MSSQNGDGGHSGNPADKSSKRRSRQAHVALTAAELAALDEAAALEGISRSDILRRAAFRGPPIGTRRMA